MRRGNMTGCWNCEFRNATSFIECRSCDKNINTEEKMEEQAIKYDARSYSDGYKQGMSDVYKQMKDLVDLAILQRPIQYVLPAGTAFINEDSSKAGSVTFEPLVMPPTLAEITQQREYKTVHKLIETLASMCAGSDKAIIENLTGYLWDEEEAGKIKAA